MREKTYNYAKEMKIRERGKAKEEERKKKTIYTHSHTRKLWRYVSRSS